MGPIFGAESETYRAVAIDGCTTLFAHTYHHASGFSYERWAPVLKAFLEMNSPSLG